MDFTYDREMRIGTMGGKTIPSVTDLIRTVGYEIHGNFERGRAAHLAFELLVNNKLDWKSVDDSIMGFVIGFEKFIKETGFKKRRSSDRLFHPTLGFHGELDLEGTWKINEYPQLIDMKTYKPDATTGIQLAGYDYLLPQLKMPRERFALELTKDGGWVRHPFDDQNDKAVFLSLLTIRNWRLNNGHKPERDIEFISKTGNGSNASGVRAGVRASCSAIEANQG